VNKVIRGLSIVAALALFSSLSSGSLAGAIVPGNIIWYEFGFHGPGMFAVNGSGTTPSSGGNSQQADDPPWTYTSADLTIVRITDAFTTGETFTLFDNATIVGSTSVPVGSPSPTTNDPEIAFPQPAYSHGAFTLPAGAHSLTIRQDAGSPGAGYFEVEVPEPASAGLLLLAGATSLLRRVRAATNMGG